MGNELTSAGSSTFTYDDNGSRATKVSGGQTTTYAYTSDNLLASISSSAITTSYIYDGENQRVAATESGTRTDFVLDPAASDELVLQEISGEQTTTYTYGLGLVSRETASGISYLLVDALGSVRLETDDDGAIVTERTYDAFGVELGNPTMAGNRFRFTGQWTDGSGLSFMRARFYDPETGAFLSVDPVPSAASQYAYCGNNPLLLVDPSGMSFVSSLAAFGKGVCNFFAGVADSVASTISLGYLHVGQPFHGRGMSTCYRVGKYSGDAASFAVAGAGMFKAYKALKWGRTAARLARDIAVNPVAPRALPLNRMIGLSKSQNEFLQGRIARLAEQGALDFRVNQQQVNIGGIRVGINRPDLQYTLNGQRFYEEFETSTLGAALEHGPRILANDPLGQFVPWRVP